MKSKMTEKEFRRDFAARCPGTNLVKPNDRVASAAVGAVLAGGVEFAPETVELPERVTVSAGGIILVPLNESPGVRLPTEDEAAAVVDRYNAYPRLREKAASLVRIIRENLATGAVAYLRDELDALEIELGYK